MRAVVAFRSALLCLAALCWVVATGLGMANAKGEPTGMITSTDLLETGEKQRRWLSLPQSRIVVNPYNFWSPLRPFQYNNGPDLPLHIGYYVGGEGLTLERLLMLRFDGRTADSFSTAWTPHALPFEAEFERMTVHGADFLYDLDTVVRRMEVVSREVVPKTEASSRAEAPGETTGPISGQFAGRYAGFVSWDAAQRILTVETRTHSYAVAFPDIVDGDITFFASEEAYLRGDPPVEFPFRQGVWSLGFSSPPSEAHAGGPNAGELNAGNPGAGGQPVELAVAIGFATAAEGAEMARTRARRALASDLRGKEAEQQAFWDAFLQKVPHPARFEISWAPDLGVKAAEVRKAYYKAWVFFAANILLPIPEVGYGYPQFPAGKPSMWAEGAALAKASATWESFFAIQLYAYVDPELAWQAFEGLMSLVDERGVIGGESLPSRKAQTAAILYHLTHDLERLKAIYPALKRYLLWRRDNPRWIHGPHNNPNERDAEFVVSVIVDMGYARDLALVLGMPEEARLWESERAGLYEKYREWFWRHPAAIPDQYYFVDTGARNRGNDLWVSTGLRLDMFDDQERLSGLLWRFRSVYNPGLAFAGFGMPKYPDISFAVYGLMDRGMIDEAKGMIDASIRDVTRANMFAEQYKDAQNPVGDGGRPSVFGAALIIDMLWLKNGYRMDLGRPHVVRLSEEGGGLDGLVVLDNELNVRLDGDRIVLSGTYLEALGAETPLALAAEAGRSLPVEVDGR